MSFPNPDKLDSLVTLVTALKQELNDLRTDFRAHDHGGTYTAATLRINGSADTVSGSEASGAVTSPVPTEFYKP